MDVAAHATQNTLAQALRMASKEHSTKMTHDSKLDDASYKNMKRNMKKQVLQMISDKSRSAEFQNLLSLQFEICSDAVLDDIPLTNEQHFEFKMSPMITKIFNKLIKEEEEGLNPLQCDRDELESMLCSMEDMLVRCYLLLNESRNQTDVWDERMNPFMDMARTLMLSWIKAYKARDAVNEIEDILAHDNSSNKSLVHCGRLFHICCKDLEMNFQSRIEL